MPDSDIGRLTVSRRSGEAIRIGEDIIIEVTALTASDVQLTVHAPRTIKVLRTELAPDEAIRHP